MCIPNMLTRDQEEIVTTLRALAGLVAQALRQKVALVGDMDADNVQALERANTEIRRQRDTLLYHTRRLLPALIGEDEERDYRQVAEWLVGDVYLQDLEAVAHHGCDPLTCTHSTHEQG